MNQTVEVQGRVVEVEEAEIIIEETIIGETIEEEEIIGVAGLIRATKVHLLSVCFFFCDAQLNEKIFLIIFKVLAAEAGVLQMTVKKMMLLLDSREDRIILQTHIQLLQVLSKAGNTIFLQNVSNIIWKF